MLKGIPSNVSSALLKALADMGHGDTIVIADHFTLRHEWCRRDHDRQQGKRYAGHARSILQLIPLDVE